MALDFTRAVTTHATLRIDLDMSGGALRLLTRPGIVVNTDSLAIEFARVKARPAADPGTPVDLRVEVGGRMRYGQVLVRPPRRTPFRRSPRP